MLLYKPWRRRIDQKRVGRAHFEPLPQSASLAGPVDGERQNIDGVDMDHSKKADISIAPVEATDVGGPAHR